MSLILDALNKAEADREREKQRQYDDPPSIKSHHDPAPVGRTPGAIKLVLIYTCGALLLIALSAGAYFWGKGGKETPAAVQPEQSSQSRPVAPPKAAAPQLARTETVKAEPKSKAIQRPKKRQSEVAALYEKPAPTPKPRPQPTQAPQPRVESTPAPEAEKKTEPQKPREPNRLSDYPQFGDIRSLPWSVQEVIPTLTYSEHNYKPNNQGHIIINGLTLKRGDRINPELMVDNILEDGVILRYKAEGFALQALSSWINM
ncbi:general secretion pathway protein B [Alteromonadaceae bacterium Bs31]|nr:general secretion pathway protein B [Alteromonadaceae bacterium Bs31]